MRYLFGLWVALALSGMVPVQAQQSASFRLEEYTFNNGGTPAAAVEPQSAGFRLTLSSLGDNLVLPAASSASHRLGGGFVTPYRPPAEVDNLLFASKTTLVWDPEVSAGTYSLYRDSVTNVVGSGFGSCEQQKLLAATAFDGDPLPLGSGFFYLVTASNLLDEEGTKGFSSDNSERPNSAPCP